MPLNYDKGKIYRLISNDKYFFIGSTTSELRYCLNQHKINSIKKQSLKVYEYYNKIGWDNVKIELLESYPCKSKKELNDRENHHLTLYKDSLLRLNVLKPVVTNEIIKPSVIKSKGVNKIIKDSTTNIKDSINNTKYSNGKIYKVTCSDGNFYIGSTICSLGQRLSNHKSDSLKNGKITTLSKHIANNKDLTLTIELIEKYPCKTNEELRAREDHHIILQKDNILCLNINRAHITSEEKKEKDKKYYEEHKNDIIEQHRKYTEDKKDQIKEYKINYRQQNTKAIKEYNKKYVDAHKEQVKEKKKKYNKENADKIKNTVKAYYEKNKEKINAYKKEWVQKKLVETAEIRAAASEEKKIKRIEKSAARIAHDNEIHTCACGGTYQNYRKTRHELSKKHMEFINT